MALGCGSENEAYGLDSVKKARPTTRAAPRDQVEASQRKWPPLTGDYDDCTSSRECGTVRAPISRAHLGIALDRIDAHRSVRPEL